MGKTMRILIVDDDPDICIMIRMMLQYKGYDVTVMDNPGNVPEVLRSGGIDLILMDMLMSGFNGIDICKSVKKEEDISDIPIIMMSAHNEAEFLCLEAGADDFISKPFELKDLLEKIGQSVIPLNKRKDHGNG